MKSTYSFKKGLVKGLLWVLNAAGVFLVMSGFSDVQVWDTIAKYGEVIFGGLTFGGLIVIVTNFVKYNWLNKEAK